MSPTTHRNASFLMLIVALFLPGGCMADKPMPAIPHRGDVVAEGTVMLSFRAPGPGLVSVYDANTNSVVQSTAVEQGSVVAVNPLPGNITVTDANRNGTQIVHTEVNKSHRYEMWFIPRTFTPMDAAATQPL